MLVSLRGLSPLGLWNLPVSTLGAFPHLIFKPASSRGERVSPTCSQQDSAQAQWYLHGESWIHPLDPLHLERFPFSLSPPWLPPWNPEILPMTGLRAPPTRDEL